jgi:MFS family permease
MAAESTRRRDPTVLVDRDVTMIATTEDAARTLSWGPIVAGLLTALGLFVLMSLLAVTIGAAVVTPDGSPPTMAATVIAAAIALASFFIGGYVASWSGRRQDEMRGALSGFLVWALWLLLVLVAGGLGLGQLFGAAGSLLDDITAPEITREQVVNALQAGSWRGFLALALGAAAAALGGAVGAMVTTRREQE